MARPPQQVAATLQHRHTMQGAHAIPRGRLRVLRDTATPTHEPTIHEQTTTTGGYHTPGRWHPPIHQVYDPQLADREKQLTDELLMLALQPIRYIWPGAMIHHQAAAIGEVAWLHTEEAAGTEW